MTRQDTYQDIQLPRLSSSSLDSAWPGDIHKLCLSTTTRHTNCYTPDAPIGALRVLLRLSYYAKVVYRVYRKFTGEVETPPTT